MTMTQTNGMAQEIPTLAAMRDAVEKIERDTYKVPTEYKIHPDDWAELRTQLKPQEVTYHSNDPLRGPDVFGLRIVLDYSAERLPRKVPNVQGNGLAATNQTKEAK